MKDCVNDGSVSVCCCRQRDGMDNSSVNDGSAAVPYTTLGSVTLFSMLPSLCSLYHTLDFVAITS